MFGHATLYIPENDDIGPTYDTGLSDELAMTIGRTVAWTLSDGEEVIVTLESGEKVIIGRNTSTGVLKVGHNNSA